MFDPIMTTFLRRQHEETVALSRDSDFVRLVPDDQPSDRYLVHFSCTGLVRCHDGAIAEANDFLVGIVFPADYLRISRPAQVVTWLGPRNVWHPNVAGDVQHICIGRVAPGTGLVDLIYQCWELITWNRIKVQEDDALNWAACEWARNHPERIPVDRRPLKRRAVAPAGPSVPQEDDRASF